MLDLILPCAIIPGLLALIITWRLRPTVTAAVLGGLLGPTLFLAVAMKVLPLALAIGIIIVVAFVFIARAFDPPAVQTRQLREQNPVHTAPPAPPQNNEPNQSKDMMRNLNNPLDLRLATLRREGKTDTEVEWVLRSERIGGTQ